MENPLIKTLLSCFCISIEGLDEKETSLVLGEIVFPEIGARKTNQGDEKRKSSEVKVKSDHDESTKITNEGPAKETFIFRSTIGEVNIAQGQKEKDVIMPENISELDSSQYDESIQKPMPKFPPNDMIEDALVKKITFRVVKQELKPISPDELISNAITKRDTYLELFALLKLFQTQPRQHQQLRGFN